MKFSYARYGHSDMPIIPVTLRHGELAMVTEALVDSGAAMSVFDALLADLLGIYDLKSGRAMTFEGVSGHTITGYVHVVTLDLDGVRIPGVNIAFTRDMPDNAVNILGQRGFFELFPIKFTYSAGEIDIMTGDYSRR